MWWPAREAAINRAAAFLKAAFHGKPLESRGMIRRTVAPTTRNQRYTRLTIEQV